MAEHDAEPRRVKENRTPGKPPEFFCWIRILFFRINFMKAVRIMQGVRRKAQALKAG